MVREAYKFAAPPLVAGAACVILSWKWPAGILFFLGLFVFYFFRDPERAAGAVGLAALAVLIAWRLARRERFLPGRRRGE